jgi:hypothetical protein
MKSFIKLSLFPKAVDFGTIFLTITPKGGGCKGPYCLNMNLTEKGGGTGRRYNPEAELQNAP